MTVVEMITDLTEWIDENVCSKVSLKKPTADRKPMDENYTYELITPKAFPMFVPSKDRLPPGIKSDVPSVCVQLTEGSDGEQRSLRINLLFSCWNPGTHKEDIIYPEGRTEKAFSYQKNGSGWMDLWNFMDVALAELEKASIIKGMALDGNFPVSYGPYKEQETIVDFYPYWFGYIQFYVKESNRLPAYDYEKFL